jgi:hypothetical protein
MIPINEETLADILNHFDEYGECSEEEFDSLVAEVRRLQSIEALARDLASQIEVYRHGTQVKDAGWDEYNNPALGRFWDTIRAIAVTYQGEPQ